MGELKTAETFLSKSLKINPKDYINLNSLGLLKMRREQFEAARLLYEQAIKINNNYHPSYNNLGLYHDRKGDKDLAFKSTTTNKDINNSNEKVLFFFSMDDLTLKKWVIFDEFENITVLEFTNIKKNISIGPNIFVVRYRH